MTSSGILCTARQSSLYWSLSLKTISNGPSRFSIVLWWKLHPESPLNHTLFSKLFITHDDHSVFIVDTTLTYPKNALLVPLFSHVNLLSPIELSNFDCSTPQHRKCEPTPRGRIKAVSLSLKYLTFSISRWS